MSERLGLQSAAWFDGMVVCVDKNIPPSRTVIRGYFHDQAALYGAIGRARDLGLTLISVNRVESPKDIVHQG